MLERFTIRTQILITFAALATISLIVISGIALVNVNLIGDITEEQASDALNDQIKRNIIQTSTENAEIIEKKFTNAEAAINTIAEATQTLFDNELQFENITSYHDTELMSIPDVANNTNYNEFISNTTSTYYFPSSELVGGQRTAIMNDTITRSAHLDPIFESIHRNNPQYVWLYVAFSPAFETVFRNFPGAAVDPVDQLYNPTEDAYYFPAVNEGGDIVYIEPYFDITQGLVISLSKAIYSTSGSLIGVVGLDFKTTTIEDKVIDVRFLESGYASLIQTSDNLVIAHPEWDSQNHDESEPIPTIHEIEINSNGDSALSTGTINTINSGNIDVTTYTKNGEVYYLAYAPILGNNFVQAQYTFLISVLVSEVIEPVDAITMRISNTVGNLRGSVILISLITLFATLAVGLWIANNLTRPIGRLTNIATQITNNATNKNIFEGVDTELSALSESDDEIGDLTRSFEGMVEKLRRDQKEKAQKESME